MKYSPFVSLVCASYVWTLFCSIIRFWMSLVFGSTFCLFSMCTLHFANSMGAKEEWVGGFLFWNVSKFSISLSLQTARLLISLLYRFFLCETLVIIKCTFVCVRACACNVVLHVFRIYYGAFRLINNFILTIAMQLTMSVSCYSASYIWIVNFLVRCRTHRQKQLLRSIGSSSLFYLFESVYEQRPATN